MGTWSRASAACSDCWAPPSSSGRYVLRVQRARLGEDGDRGREIGEDGADVPADGTTTVALGACETVDGRLVGTAADVPWPGASTVLLAVRAPDATYVAVLPPWTGTPTANPAGEPRAAVEFDVATLLVSMLIYSPITCSCWPGSRAPSNWVQRVP